MFARMKKFDCSWTYGICESCLKNVHERHEMKKEVFTEGNKKVEMWVCKKCGSTKRL